MFLRQNINQNAKIIFLGNYFWNLETTVFIYYVFIAEIYLRNIWRDNWRSVFDVVKRPRFCLSISRRKKYWHIYCCFVIMLKLWSLKMCYAVWSFMIYVQLPFIQFLHFHDLFKKEEFIINKRKAIQKTSWVKPV